MTFFSSRFLLADGLVDMIAARGRGEGRLGSAVPGVR
jgi:hypothetical protein